MFGIRNIDWDEIASLTSQLNEVFEYDVLDGTLKGVLENYVTGRILIALGIPEVQNDDTKSEDKKIFATERCDEDVEEEKVLDITEKREVSGLSRDETDDSD